MISGQVLTVSARQGVAEPGGKRLQLDELGSGDALGRSLGQKAFERPAQLIERLRLGARRQPGDIRSLAALADDEPVSLENAHGLAHGRAADPEPTRQLVLGDALTGGQIALDDLLLEHLADELGIGRRDRDAAGLSSLHVATIQCPVSGSGCVAYRARQNVAGPDRSASVSPPGAGAVGPGTRPPSNQGGPPATRSGPRGSAGSAGDRDPSTPCGRAPRHRGGRASRECHGRRTLAPRRPTAPGREPCRGRRRAPRDGSGGLRARGTGRSRAAGRPAGDRRARATRRRIDT